MPSTYTASLRFEMQGSGENLNAWGTRLNSALARIDKSIAGRTAITLTGAHYTLTSSTTADDEARSMILDLSGAGGCNLVIPGVSKAYLVRNGSTGSVTVTMGGGATVEVGAGDTAWVFCDGAGVSPLKIGGVSIREYIDAQAWAVSSAALPGQTGNAGKFLKTNGSTPSWSQPAVADIGDYAADQSSRQATILASAQATALNLAVAMAAAL